MPTQRPAISASESGVSNTRSTPKRSCNPAVARKTPPLTPTSSPNTTTSGSSASARASARLIASTSVSSGILVLDILALGDIGRRQSGVEMVEHRLRRTRLACQVAFDCRLYALLTFAGDFFFVSLAPTHAADEIGAQPRNRFFLPMLLDFVRRPITRSVVGR